MKYITVYFAILLSSLLLISCSGNSVGNDNDDDNNQPEVSSNYIISATPTALEDVADYLLTAQNLSQGSVSTLGDGIEQDGTYRYYITSNNTFYSLLYGQENPGAVTAYKLNSEGNLEQLVDFQSESMHVFNKADDDILMMKVSRSSNDPTALWFQLDTKTNQFVNEGQINTAELAGNGEMAYFSWVTQVGDQIYAPYFSITGEGNNIFSTQHPDNAWIAVYSYPEMELQNVITDDRTSFIGRYFTNGLSVDENGDVYAFSSAVATNDNNEFNSTKPSAITRINNGETEFDQNYFFNIEEASDGYHLTDHQYINNGDVLLLLTEERTNPYATGKHFAIVNVYDQTFTWVDGLPNPEGITSVTYNVNNYVSDDGSTVYTGITTEEGSYVYALDIATAIATQGLEVEGGIITAINKLEVPEG